MTDTFTWPVTSDVSGGGEFIVNSTKFGDGYEQSEPQGLNNDRQKWTVTFVGNVEECQEVIAFIRSKQGAESFFWKPPLGVTGYYKCKSYKPTNQGGLLYTLALDFEQSYFP